MRRVVQHGIVFYQICVVQTATVLAVPRSPAAVSGLIAMVKCVSRPTSDNKIETRRKMMRCEGLERGGSDTVYDIQ